MDLPCIIYSLEIKMKKYPLKLSYVTKTALWAGKRLKTDFNKESNFETVSESWELSVRNDEMSRITNGEASGLTLLEYFETVGFDSVAPSFKKGDRFPLLVKLIDAADMLSIQVHPDDKYASEVEHDSGKTEMWHVVDACEGATLIYGLREGVSGEDFASASRENKIGQVINTIPVKAGQTYFIPAGMLHAIGSGILIAEIQQNSDLTYRVYDFDRKDKDGNLRPLHVDKAIDVTRPYSEDEITAVRFAKGDDLGVGECLANSEYFSVRRLTVGEKTGLSVSDDSFMSVLCIEGDGNIIYDGECFPVSKGDSYFLPARMGEFEVEGNMTLILSEI